MKTVVIIDDDSDFNTSLTNVVNEHPDFNVVAQAISGHDGRLYIDHYMPNVVILDIIMPGHDGLRTIKYIREAYDNYNPYIIVISGVNTASMSKMLLDLKVDFVEYKPLDNDSFSDILEQISKDTDRTIKDYTIRKEKRDLADVMEDVLHEVGAPPELIGYLHIKTALYFIIERPNERPQIYKEVPAILGVSKNKIEKSIRRVIDSCERINTDLYFSLFGKNQVNNLNFLYNLAICIEKRMRESERKVDSNIS